MPALEENPKTNANNSQQEVTQVFDYQLPQPPHPEQPARERTQTDVLNNRLLKSLLTRMNTSSGSDATSSSSSSGNGNNQSEDAEFC